MLKSNQPQSMASSQEVVSVEIIYNIASKVKETISRWVTAYILAAIGIAIYLFVATLAMKTLAGEPPKKITEKQAVKIAEQFIAENGYTAGKPSAKPLVLEFGMTEAQELALRHNSLEPKAYGIIDGAGKGSRGWTVIFQYSKESPNSIRQTEGTPALDQPGTGRAVTMDAFGNEVRVQHQDIYLKAAQKKL